MTNPGSSPKNVGLLGGEKGFERGRYPKMDEGRDTVHKVIIAGSGPAGLTAGLYAARANLAPVMIAGHQWGGGQLMETTDVENYPGFPEGILGPELIEVMKKQALRFGLNYVEGQVAEADLSRRPFKLVTDDGRAFQCRTLIISTGASARWLGLEKEQKLKMGGGVSACATCDGALPMYRGQELAVVGGGDSAMEEALFLTRFASKVTIIHRRDAFRASKIMQQRALSNPKIAVKWNRVVEDLIETNERLAGLVLRDTVNRATEHFPVGGGFLWRSATRRTRPFSRARSKPTPRGSSKSGSRQPERPSRGSSPVAT